MRNAMRKLARTPRCVGSGVVLSYEKRIVRGVQLRRVER